MLGVCSCNTEVIRENVLPDKGWHLVIILEWSVKRKHPSHNFAKFRSPWPKSDLKSNSYKGWHLVIILEWSGKRKHPSQNFAKFRSPWLKPDLKSNSLDVSISIPYATNDLLDHNPCFHLDQKCSLIFSCLTCLRLDYVVERSRLIVMFGVGNAVYGRAIHN